MPIQELINIYYKYSIEIDMNFNALSSFCIAFTPRLLKLTLPSLHSNYLPILYIGYIFSNNNNDDAEFLRQ